MTTMRPPALPPHDIAWAGTGQSVLWHRGVFCVFFLRNTVEPGYDFFVARKLSAQCSPPPPPTSPHNSFLLAVPRRALAYTTYVHS